MLMYIIFNARMIYLLKILLSLFLSWNFLLSYCVTFNLDLNDFPDEPNGSWVARANGSWNNWGTGITLSDDDGDGIHTAIDCGFSN